MNLWCRNLSHFLGPIPSSLWSVTYFTNDPLACWWKVNIASALTVTQRVFGTASLSQILFFSHRKNSTSLFAWISLLNKARYDNKLYIAWQHLIPIRILYTKQITAFKLGNFFRKRKDDCSKLQEHAIGGPRPIAIFIFRIAVKTKPIILAAIVDWQSFGL